MFVALFLVCSKSFRRIYEQTAQRCAVVRLGCAIFGQICCGGVVRDFASKKASKVIILMIGARLDDYVPLGDVGFVQLVRTIL